MKLLRILPMLLGLFIFTACGEDENEYYLGGEKPSSTPTTQSNSTNNNQNSTSQNEYVGRLEFPHVRGGNSLVVVHTDTLNSQTKEWGVNYSLEWDTDLHAQRWCCYQMNSSLRQTNTRRYEGDRKQSLTPESPYPNDPFLDERYQFTVDPFWGSGYDHGHICASADRLASRQSNYQTFFLTNMMPQVNDFNAGIWAVMEAKVRDWSRNYKTLYVCKGGTIDSASNIIRYLGSGMNRIPVPKYFFMALLGETSQGQYTAIGLWIEHKSGIDQNTNVGTYAKNIHELEELTGIDFFCNLPDGDEEEIENRNISNLKAVWGL